jgi:hemerythrin-like metal-binding protein
MTPKQARLLAESFKKIENRLHDFGSLVHERLFEIAPESRRLFKGDLEEQKLKMARVFAEFVRLKARPHPFMSVTGKAGETILPGIGALGARHELNYGVRSKHFSYMREALLYAIKTLLGRDYNDEVGQAWSETFDMLADAMQKQAGDSGEAVAFLRLSHRRGPDTRPPLVAWSDKLSVGVELIDSEHKRLVNLLNELNRAVEEGAGQGALGGVLSGLVNYTHYHFSHEEELARRSRFPGYERHRRQHEGFTAKVLEVYANFQSGEAAGLPGEVLEFLKVWLSQHILGSDRELGAYLNSNPAALSRHE